MYAFLNALILHPTPLYLRKVIPLTMCVCMFVCCDQNMLFALVPLGQQLQGGKQSLMNMMVGNQVREAL